MDNKSPWKVERPKEPYTPDSAHTTVLTNTSSGLDREVAGAEDGANTGVENVRTDVVAAKGMPVNPATPYQAQRQALTVPVTTAKDNGYSASNYAELIEQLQQRLNEFNPLSKDELEKLRRKQRTEGFISGIADAATALSNLFFTTRYAPNMYNHKEGLTVKAQERIDKAKAQREADNDRFFNYAMMLGRVRDAADVARERREMAAYERERNALDDQYRAQAEARDKAIYELRIQLMKGQISEQEAAARIKGIQERYAEQYEQSRIAKNYSSGNRTATQGQFTIKRTDPQTGEVEYKSGFKSEAAARNYASTHANDGWVYVTTPTTTTNSSTNTDWSGFTSTRETTSTRDVSTPRVEVDWD